MQLTQAIGLAHSFETALTKLLGHYTFLGVTEHLSTSLRHLGQSHGLPDLQEYHENVGRTAAAAEISPQLRSQIEERSQNDQKIHQLLMQLYPAQEA